MGSPAPFLANPTSLLADEGHWPGNLRGHLGRGASGEGEGGRSRMINWKGAHSSQDSVECGSVDGAGAGSLDARPPGSASCGRHSTKQEKKGPSSEDS